MQLKVKIRRLRSVADFLDSKGIRDKPLPLSIDDWGKFIIGKTIGCFWCCAPKFPVVVITSYLNHSQRDISFLMTPRPASTAQELACRLRNLAQCLADSRALPRTRGMTHEST